MRSSATRYDIEPKCVAVAAIEPQFYAALLSVIDLDPTSLPPQNERAQWPAMRERFAAVFRRRNRDAWVQPAKGRGACLAPVLTIDAAPQHPQMVARATFTAFDGVLHPSPAPRLSATPGTLRRPAPLPGQHQAKVLQIGEQLETGKTRCVWENPA